MESIVRRNVVRSALLGALVFASGALIALPAFAVQFTRALDVYQGFNFKHDKQNEFGYITALKVGGQTMKADLTGTDPTTGKTFPVVGVLNHYQWETGVTDAIYLSGQLSAGNRTGLQAMLLQGIKDANVEFGYVIYQYDPVLKKYFINSSSQQSSSLFVLKGFLGRNGTEVNLLVADGPAHEIQSPLNFTFQIGINPVGQQIIPLATAPGKNLIKPWGLKAP